MLLIYFLKSILFSKTKKNMSNLSSLAKTILLNHISRFQKITFQNLIKKVR